MEDHSFSESSAPETPHTRIHETGRRRSKGQSRKFPWKIVIFALVILLLGFVAWFILTPPPDSEVSSDVSIVSDESSSQVITDTPTPTPEPVEKSEITFEILNGTGIPKEASFLVDEITKLGYEQFDTGNADDDTHETTVVTYRSDLSQTVKDEITKLLKNIYENVEEKSGSGDIDVQVIVGYKKGHTPTVTSAPVTKTPTPTTTQGSATSTITPTVTEAPTATPS